MNYDKHLSKFFELASNDHEISTTQIALFMALFQSWNLARFAERINIIRDEIMKLARISSKATYHKSMAFLHRKRYINYFPSYNPLKGSMIEFFPHSREADNNQKGSTHMINAEPVRNLDTRPLNEPYILYNNINNNSIDRYNEIDNTCIKNEHVSTNEISTVSKKPNSKIPPELESVKNYFLTNHSTLFEAQRFYNYYAANGWLVGGKTPMQDWEASANNWITNSLNFNGRSYGNSNSNSKDRARHLHTTTNKDYSEPL